MSASDTSCPKREQIEEYCSCPKRDCPRHGLCCECIVEHKGRAGQPVLKRLPHCLRDMVAGANDPVGMNPVETIWIIGAGRFGRHAAAGLEAEGIERRLVLVDPSEESLAGAAGGGRILIQADGTSHLAQHLAPGAETDVPDWIVPAVPVHLPAEWCLARLGPERLRRQPVPSEVLELLPNPMVGTSGDVYVSHARFRCPADCSEPEETCTVTRRPRARNLFEVLGELQVPPHESLVVRSHQLGAGIGGYRPGQLFSLLSQVERAGPRLLVSTACRCHGVATALEHLG